MKQANHNEVDLLLRSLARGRGESALQNRSGSGDGHRAGSDHLDADELNSYAEGVVPAAARVRYTEHLADCDACRGVVVGLTQAAGVATRAEVPAQKGGLGIWDKLSALISPPVLRYAVPALVLTAVIGVSLLALRQPRHELMALNQPAGSSATTGQLNPTESPAGHTANDAPGTKQKGVEAPAVDYSTTDTSKPKNETAGSREEARAADDENLAGASVAKDAVRPGDTRTLSELRPSYAPEPKAAAPPLPQTSQSEGESLAIAKEQPAKREGQERQRDDAIRNQPSDEHGPNRSARNAGAPLSSQRVEGLTAGRSGPNTQNKTDKAGEVETRTVSGRRFAREGNAWVDTAYDSSRATTNVARGSEQFRALVADEPGLGAIAQQLNGVVIVVWKNRVYRIQ